MTGPKEVTTAKLDESRAVAPRGEGGVGPSNTVGWVTRAGEKTLKREGVLNSSMQQREEFDASPT